MLKTTLTTIKKVCVFTLVPRIWRGHVKQSPGKFEKFPTVLTKAEKSSDTKDGNLIENKTTKEDREKAQRIIDYTFGNGEYPQEIIIEFQRAIEAELVKERLSREAKQASEYKSQEDDNFNKPMQETVLNASTTNQDHTNQDDENRLVQKIEKIRETPLVEAETPKIEDVDDLKTIPPLLGQPMKYQSDYSERNETEKVKSFTPDEVAEAIQNISQRPQPYVDFRKPNVMPLQPDPKRHVKVLFSDPKTKQNVTSPEYSDITKGKLTEKEEALIKEIENINLKHKIPQFSPGVDNVQENIKTPDSVELAITDHEPLTKKDETDRTYFEQSTVQEIDEETEKQRLFKHRWNSEGPKGNITGDFDTPILPLNLHEQKHNLALMSNTEKPPDFYTKSHETRDECNILPNQEVFQNQADSRDVHRSVEDNTQSINRTFDEHGNCIEKTKPPEDSKLTNWLDLKKTPSDAYFEENTHEKQKLDEIHKITMKDMNFDRPPMTSTDIMKDMKFDRPPRTSKDNNIMNVIQGTSLSTSDRCYHASKSPETLFDKLLKRVTRRKEKSDNNEIKPQPGQTVQSPGVSPTLHAVPVPQANWTEDQEHQNPLTPSQSQNWQSLQNSPSPDQTLSNFSPSPDQNVSNFGTNPQDNRISFATVTPSVIDKVVYEKKYGPYTTPSGPSDIPPLIPPMKQNHQAPPKLDVYANVTPNEPSLQKPNLPNPTLNTPSASWTTTQRDGTSENYQNIYENQHEANLRDINSTPNESWTSPQQHGTSYNYQSMNENQQSDQNYSHSMAGNEQNYVESQDPQQETNMPYAQQTMFNQGHEMQYPQSNMPHGQQYMTHQGQNWQQPQTNMSYGQQYNMKNHGQNHNWQNFTNLRPDGANYNRLINEQDYNNYNPANNLYESQIIGNKASREHLQEVHEKMLPTPDHRGKYALMTVPTPRDTFHTMISPHGSGESKSADKTNVVSNYYARKEYDHTRQKGTNQSFSNQNYYNTESAFNRSTISINPQQPETVYDVGKNVNASLQETTQQENQANNNNLSNQGAIQMYKDLNPRQPYYENFNINSYNPGVFTENKATMHSKQSGNTKNQDQEHHNVTPNNYQNTMTQNIAGHGYNNYYKISNLYEEDDDTSDKNYNAQYYPLRGTQQDFIQPNYSGNYYIDYNQTLNQTFDYNQTGEKQLDPKIIVPKNQIGPHNTTNSTHLFVVAEQKLKESQTSDDKNEGDISLDIAPPAHYSDKDHYVYKNEPKSNYDTPQQQMIETSLPIMNQPVKTAPGTQINPSITNVYNYNSQDLSHLTPEQIKWLQFQGMIPQNAYANRYQNYFYPNKYYNPRQNALPNYNKNAVSKSQPVYKLDTSDKTAYHSLENVETKDTDLNSSHVRGNVQEYALPRDFTTDRGEETLLNKTWAANDVISPSAINTYYPDMSAQTDMMSAKAKTEQHVDEIDISKTSDSLNKPIKTSPDYRNKTKLGSSTPSTTPKMTVIDESTASKTGKTTDIKDIMKKHKKFRTSNKVPSKIKKADKTIPGKNSPINTASTVMTTDSFQQLGICENNHEDKQTQDINKSPKYYERLGRLVDTAVRYKRVDVLQDETPTDKEYLDSKTGKNIIDPSTLGDKYTVFTTGDNSPSNKPGNNQPSAQDESERLSRSKERTEMEPVENRCEAKEDHLQMQNNTPFDSNQPNNEGMQTIAFGKKQLDYPTHNLMYPRRSPYYQGQDLQNFQTCESQNSVEEKSQEQEFCSDVIKEINKDVQKIINSEQHINRDIKEIARFIEQNTDKLQQSLEQYTRERSREQETCDTDVQEINKHVQEINRDVQDINRDVQEINRFIEKSANKLHQSHSKDISGLSNDESPCQSAEIEIAKWLEKIEGKHEREQSPRVNPKPTHGGLGPCGREESDAKLSQLLDSIRMRNRLETEEELEMNSPETKEEPCGKCGDKKTCPPPPPKCEPPPCPKKPCTPPTPPKCPPPKCPPPPPPDCPKPPECPKPPKCDPCPPKKCCVGITESPNGPRVIMEDTLTFLMASTTVCDSGSSIFRCIRGTRDYEPWTPLPCWPVPRQHKKMYLSQKPFCPQQCLQAPPIKDGEFCKPREKPCSGFPKRLTFSLTDLNVLDAESPQCTFY